jgi:3-hydroxyacyl-[acyl-carrier-protein] dehydratase
MRFYLLDRVSELIPGKSIEGIKCWSMSEEIFNEHFPGFPVVPGVLLTETMAQLLGLLIEKSHETEYQNKAGVYVILSIIHKAKFRNFVIPGDQCIVKGELKSIDLNRASGHAKTFVDGNCVADAELSFLIIPKDAAPENKYAHRREEYRDILLSKFNRFDEA